MLLNKRIFSANVSARHAAGLFAATMIAVASFALTAFAQINVTWTSLNLETDGSASWDYVCDSKEEVDRYEVRVARLNNGSWNTSYKTLKPEENNVDINFTQKGKYYFTVRAKFIGGEYSNWSGQSNTVIVNSEDVNPIDHSTSSSATNQMVAYMPYTDQLTGVTYYRAYTITSGPTGWKATLYQQGPGAATGFAYSMVPAGAYVLPAGTTIAADGTLILPAGTVLPWATNAGTTISGSGVAISNTITAYPGATPAYTFNTGTQYQTQGQGYASAANTYNGWKFLNNHWYYIGADGSMVTGWIMYNGQWYYLLPGGPMATGWNKVGEKWYYFNENGAMLTGYINFGGKTYYCDPTGARVENSFNSDGHLFNLNGEMVY